MLLRSGPVPSRGLHRDIENDLENSEWKPSAYATTIRSWLQRRPWSPVRVFELVTRRAPTARWIALISLLVPFIQAMVSIATNADALAQAISAGSGGSWHIGELTAAEQTLIDAARTGAVANYCKPGEEDPAEGSHWGPSHTIRASVLRSLATGENPSWAVGAKGIQTRCARIVDRLDLSGERVARPLELEASYIDEGVILYGTSALYIDLAFSYVNGEVRADGLNVQRDLELENLVAKEGVFLDHATLGSDLYCLRGRFLGFGLDARGIHVVGSVYLAGHKRRPHRSFVAENNIDFEAAEIGHDLDFSGADLSGVNVDLADAKITGTLDFNEIAKGSSNTDIYLDDAQVGKLDDDPDSWRKVGFYRLRDFEYQKIQKWPVDQRKEWLERQSRLVEGLPDYHEALPLAVLRAVLCAMRITRPIPFNRQPYEQLAAVLRQAGYVTDAREILIAEQSEEWKSGQLSFLGLLLNCFLYWTIGYGYAWRWGLYWLIVLLGFGTFLARLAYRRRIIRKWEFEIGPRGTHFAAPTHEAPRNIAKLRAEPRFRPLLWSLDSFNFPFLDLRQKEHFRLIEPSRPLHKTCWWRRTRSVFQALRRLVWRSPRPRRQRCFCYTCCEWYFAFHAAVAWILLALIVAAITGAFEKV